MTPVHRANARTLSVLGALLCCAFALGGCVKVPLGSVESTGPAPAAKPAVSTPATTAVLPKMVGFPQTKGSWRVTVIKARTNQKGPGGAKPAAKKSFLHIEVQFNNVQMSQSLTPRPEYFSLKNAAGKKFATFSTMSGYNLHGMRSIDPGYGGMTEFVYQVPKGTSDYVFTVELPNPEGKPTRLSWSVP